MEIPIQQLKHGNKRLVITMLSYKADWLLEKSPEHYKGCKAKNDLAKL